MVQQASYHLQHVRYIEIALIFGCGCHYIGCLGGVDMPRRMRYKYAQSLGTSRASLSCLFRRWSCPGIPELRTTRREEERFTLIAGGFQLKALKYLPFLAVFMLVAAVACSAADPTAQQQPQAPAAAAAAEGAGQTAPGAPQSPALAAVAATAVPASQVTKARAPVSADVA